MYMICLMLATVCLKALCIQKPLLKDKHLLVLKYLSLTLTKKGRKKIDKNINRRKKKNNTVSTTDINQRKKEKVERKKIKPKKVKKRKKEKKHCIYH